MTSSTVYPNTGRPPRPAASPVRVVQAWVAALALGCAGCSQSDSFLGAQIDFQLRQGDTPTLDLGKVGPVTWTRVCVLGPGTDDRAAQALLGLPWPASRLTSLADGDERVALVFSDGAKVLAFVERPRADGDFTTVQPPCLTRAEARLETQRAADGRLRVQRPATTGR
jgi:hypothetical protein